MNNGHLRAESNYCNVFGFDNEDQAKLNGTLKLK